MAFLYLAPLVPALLIPSVALTPPTLPTTSTLAVGVLESSRTLKGDLYKGGSDTLDLSSMLDTVPQDLKGEQGVSKDEEGVAAMAARSEKKLTPAEQQAAKKAAFAAKQAADAEKPFFPPVALPGF